MTFHHLRGVLETIQPRHGLTFCSVGLMTHSRHRSGWQGLVCPSGSDKGPAGPHEDGVDTVGVKRPEFEHIPLQTWPQLTGATGH